MSRLTALRLAVAVTIVAVCMGGALVASQKSAANMARTATAFLDSLSADQRAKAVLPFDDADRLRWHFIPNEMFPRQGLMLKDMNESQRTHAFDLLRSGLSSHGYVKVRAIMELEDVLRAAEAGGRFARNKEEYLFSVFGTPGVKGNWGWRFEGHHVSLRFTIANGAMKGDLASTPMFLGSNPAVVLDGPMTGRSPLREEQLQARQLMLLLPPALQKQAIVNSVAPTDILTMNKNDITPLPDEGVAFHSMAPAQQAQLVRLIEAYTSTMDADIAAARMAKIKAAGMDTIRFAWAGEIEPGKKHYYRIQGPTFLVEFDNTQNNGNHVHSVWRDFSGDFGRDLLREHVSQVAH